MFKIVILILFILVLSADFILAVSKLAVSKENWSIFNMFIRAFMVISFCLLCEWF